MISYFNGNYLPVEEIKISPYDRGFMFADGVYEVCRTYKKKFFMIKDHLERLERNLQLLNINFSAAEELESVGQELINLNNPEGEVTFYIQITRGTAYPRTHRYPDGMTPTVFATLNPVAERKHELKKGISVITTEDIRWRRCDIKSISILASVIAAKNAELKNAEETLWIKNGRILEGTHTNFIGIKNQAVYTAPLSESILPGITRKVIKEICRKSGIDFIEENIKLNEIENFDEFAITGTTTEITPVIKINDTLIGNGVPGIMTRKLQDLFYKFTEE
ncbi:MAG: aminotransferase class IV [Ignavibacteriaceae bacterium]